MTLTDLKTERVIIKWLNTGREEDVLVALEPYTAKVPDEIDEDIFFYFEDEVELESAVADEEFNHDFMVVSRTR